MQKLNIICTQVIMSPNRSYLAKDIENCLRKSEKAYDKIKETNDISIVNIQYDINYNSQIITCILTYKIY